MAPPKKCLICLNDKGIVMVDIYKPLTISQKFWNIISYTKQMMFRKAVCDTEVQSILFTFSNYLFLLAHFSSPVP